MVSEHRYTLLDVFTSVPLQGNPLAVVHDADDIDEATMLAFARETRLSETTFVQSATVAGADYRNRIWDLRDELPFAGHPSLGTAVAVARARGETSAAYVQQTIAGLQPVEVELTGRLARASILQEPAVFGAELDADDVLRCAGLSAPDADPELPVQVVSCGVPQVIAPVRAGALARVRPDWPAVGELLDANGAITLYLSAVDTATGRARARSLARDASMGEDPATGSAAGPLMAYVAQRTGAMELTIAQGVEMGRPSELRCAIEGERVRVSGDAVVVIEGTLAL
jgi:trans-2,3-dihydro-3-hydroxyanthranilate isomerase